MLKVMCPVSLTEAYVDCGCPDGHVPAAEGAHHEECPLWDIGAMVSCPPDSGCCQEEHSHSTAANSCTADHSSEACPEAPGKCRLWRDVRFHATGGVQAAPPDMPKDCPGGHCHKDLSSCAVCHPVIITQLGGATMKRAGA